MNHEDANDGMDNANSAEAPAPANTPGAAKRKGKNKIKFEATMQRQEAAVYFRALVDGLDKGRLEFRQGEEVLELLPSETVSVEVKANDKGSKQKVTFELEWRSEAGRFEVNG